MGGAHPGDQGAPRPRRGRARARARAGRAGRARGDAGLGLDVGARGQPPHDALRLRRLLPRGCRCRRSRPSYALLLPAALLLGAGNGSLDVAMNAHGVAVERRHESPILSSFHAAFSCGALVGAGASALAAGADARRPLAPARRRGAGADRRARRLPLAAARRRGPRGRGGRAAARVAAARAVGGRRDRVLRARLRGGDRGLERGLRPRVARVLRRRRGARLRGLLGDDDARPAARRPAHHAPGARRRSCGAAACCPRRASGARC